MSTENAFGPFSGGGEGEVAGEKLVEWSIEKEDIVPVRAFVGVLNPLVEG
jgi:hypothetical protein